MIDSTGESARSYMSLNVLKTVYFSYFNIIISYGLILGGNLPHSLKVFRMQKKIIRIMMGWRSRTSCRNLFSKLKMLPLASQYIFSLMLFVVKNKDLFISNSEKNITGTRQ
jgi:hypothetical protein